MKYGLRYTIVTNLVEICYKKIARSLESYERYTGEKRLDDGLTSVLVTHRYLVRFTVRSNQTATT